MKLKLSRHIFEKYWHIKFHENPPSGRRGVAWGKTGGRTDRQTDRHEEANSRFSQFFGRTKHAWEQNAQELRDLNLTDPSYTG
jgi:hypothetical protein